MLATFYTSKNTEETCTVVLEAQTPHHDTVNTMKTHWSDHRCYRVDKVSLVLTSAAGINPVSDMIARRDSSSKRSGCLTTDVDDTMPRRPRIRAEPSKPHYTTTTHTTTTCTATTCTT